MEEKKAEMEQKSGKRQTDRIRGRKTEKNGKDRIRGEETGKGGEGRARGKKPEKSGKDGGRGKEPGKDRKDRVRGEEAGKRGKDRVHGEEPGKREKDRVRGEEAGKRGKDGVRGKETGKSREKGNRERKTEDAVKKRKKEGLCHAFGECGGCQLLGIPYEEQLGQKERELKKLLKPYVKLEGMIGMENPEHYRNKVSAAFTHDRSGKPLSGVYKEGTHYIIPIEKCVLENEKADEIIGSIRGLLPSFKIKTYDEDMDYGLLRHVMVRVGHATGEIMVVLVLASPIMPSKNNFVKALLKLHPEITTIILNVNERRTSMVLGDKEQVIYGKGYIEDVLCGIRFKISPKSFYQINSVQTEKLYGKAVEYAGLTGTETVLDAYCGIGTIGMIAASKAKRVIGVELNRDAVKDAVMNAKKNQIGNAEFYQKDAGEFMVQLAEQGERIDTVFMDPPRTGSDEKFLEALAVLRPKKVVYISCNPETLVRDLDVLVKKGYRVDRGVGCDMFPFCGHVETIVSLSRVK